ncbi:MAG: ribosomal protein S18-alanine N-acetyltransferase [Candidatus Marinimicrobia bacterium]|nr:ribosomal protein S18-alanine N-acetyltransferase [Candidatus Neomarinimicrobiota bacterium]
MEVKVKAEIREATADDIEMVMEIEELSFENPWSEFSFMNELRNPVTRFYVVEVEDKVRGFVIFWYIDDEIHIANLAVHPEKRRMGLGRMLLEKVIKEAKENGILYIYLDVNSKNEEAKKLYFKYGFEVVGVRKKYYNNRDDALLLTKKIES